MVRRTDQVGEDSHSRRKDWRVGFGPNSTFRAKPRLWLLGFALLWAGFELGTVASFEGEPLFVEVSKPAGVVFRHQNGASAEKYIIETMGSGGGFLDYDNDGWLDIYLVNTAGKNKLFHNNGSGQFIDVTEKAGVGGPDHGMGCTFGDYDNDGFVDIFVTAFGPDTLYRNNGDGTFKDVTARAGSRRPALGYERSLGGL